MTALTDRQPRGQDFFGSNLGRKDSQQPKSTVAGIIFNDRGQSRNFKKQDLGNGKWSISGSVSVTRPGLDDPTKNEVTDLMHEARKSRSTEWNGKTFTAYGSKSEVDGWANQMKSLHYSED